MKQMKKSLSKFTNILFNAGRALALLCVILFVSCASVSYSSIYKNNKDSVSRNILLLLIYQVPSERIQEIIDNENRQILLQKEIERVAQRNQIDISLFKRTQLQRVQQVNTMYSEQLKRGMFTDRGRIYIKYGEPQSIMESTDSALGTIQKWVYSEPTKTFIFIYNSENYSYRLYNMHDEEIFK